MIIVMQPDAGESAIAAVESRILAEGLRVHISRGTERTLIGAQGTAFDLTTLQRCLIASRVPWFYAGKLLWPANLIFMYPRWE